MFDHRTPHLDLPLPSAGNKLSEDLPRLSEALLKLDASVHQKAAAADVDAALAEQASAVDHVRIEVNAALEATTTAVLAETGQITADLTRRVRRLRISNLINLDI